MIPSTRDKIAAPYIAQLREHVGDEASEEGHMTADYIICELLNQLGYEDVVREYDKIEKWYS